MAKVLICGVYLADREHCAGEAIVELASSTAHQVTQRWVALDVSGTGNCNLEYTVKAVRQPAPQFYLINEILTDVAAFDYLIVCDDDVGLPAGFTDKYLGCVERLDLSLSQPARTPDSSIGHSITARMPGLRGRVTRFVEIGPVFCIQRRAFHCILPFDQRTRMGWGLDLVWPKLMEMNGLRMGIIDATPVSHTIRPDTRYYSHDAALKERDELLRTTPHLSFSEAYAVLETYA